MLLVTANEKEYLFMFRRHSVCGATHLALFLKPLIQNILLLNTPNFITKIWAPIIGSLRNDSATCTMGQQLSNIFLA